MSGAIVRRHFDVMFGCFVFGSVSFAFQSVLLGIFRSFFIIGWKKDVVWLCRTFFGLPLTAVESLVLVDNVMEYQIINSLSRTNAFLPNYSTQPIW